MSNVTAASSSPLQGRAPARASAPLVVFIIAIVVAGGLRTLDHVVPWLKDEPRGTERFRSLDALERDIGTQLILPIFFPDVLEWPPAEIYRARGANRPTSVVFRHRASGAPGLVVAQCLDGDCDMPDRLLSAGRVRESRRIELGGTDAILEHGRDSGRGADYVEITTFRFDRRVIVRWYGDDMAVALRIARSLRRGRP